ncbi:MAG: hypothetical protein ACYCPS_03550 [Candidatus Saccharimonadales bacterium]
MTINFGEGTSKERHVITPIADGSPVYPTEEADLAELRRGLSLKRTPWLQAVIDAEGNRPPRAAVFKALQAHIQELVSRSERDLQSERRAIVVAYDVLRRRITQVSTGEVRVMRMWLWLRAHEAYAAPNSKLQPGVPVPHITGAAWESCFATGWELGYEADNAERWFVTQPLIAGVERLDFPLDSIHEVREAPAAGFVEISGIQVGNIRSLTTKTL